MDKPLATVMGVDDMPRALRDSTQGGARAGRMGPDVAFDESPCGFDGTEVMRVRRQIAQRGASRRRTHSTKNRVLTARHLVFSVTQPVRRIAPINVKFSPQFIGRGSTYSWPRRTHAWERPIARFAPASSSTTKRAGSIVRTHLRNAARFAWMSGRSTSLGRRRFF